MSKFPIIRNIEGVLDIACAVMSDETNLNLPSMHLVNEDLWIDGFCF